MQAMFRDQSPIVHVSEPNMGNTGTVDAFVTFSSQLEASFACKGFTDANGVSSSISVLPNQQQVTYAKFRQNSPPAVGELFIHTTESKRF